jgi:NADH:ubiquinone oxidoreductase subunit 4 (subunit M)
MPEWLAWVPMLLLIVFLGVYPHALFKTTDGAVTQTTVHVAPSPTLVAQGS